MDADIPLSICMIVVVLIVVTLTCTSIVTAVRKRLRP